MPSGAIITTLGLAKLASATPLNQLNISALAVGDGNGGYPTLDPSMTTLTNEVWRGTPSPPIRDPNSPNVLIFEAVIPPSVGGFTVREQAIFDDAGDMIAIGQTSVVEKPLPNDATGVILTVRLHIQLDNAGQVDLFFQDDPTISADNVNNANGGSVQDFIDDYDGFTAALLAEAGIVDDGQPDKLGASQRVDAINTIFRNTYFSGPVRSLSQSQFSLSATMTPATQTARVQGFIDSFISTGGCAVIDQDAIIDDVGVYTRSGVDIRFTNESKFTKEPTAAQGYGVLWVSGVKNANIYSPRLIGDKYSHLADTGESGMGLRIIGECDNVIIHNPICDEMWADGIYIGADSNNKYPSGAGVTIYNPVCRKNRRQGISYIGGVVRIIDPICEDTKSSDSRFTLSAGPHAGIDIEPNNADPVIDIEILNPKTARNDGDGILFTPFFIKTAHNLKVKITNHVDDGSRHSFRVLADNDLFSGFVHYDGFGQNNKLCALYIDAWKKCAGCDVNIHMRTKAWGRDTSSAKFGAAYAWGASLTTDGGVKIRLSCIDTADKPYVAYHLGPTDINLKITTDNNNAVSLISSEGSVISVEVDGPFKKQMTLVNVGYTDFFNSFQVDGSGGNRSLGFESSWFANMRDGDSVVVDAKNCAQLLIQTTASQYGQGGAIIRPDGTLGNYRVTAGPQKVINVRFVKYGYFMLISSMSGGVGVNV